MTHALLAIVTLLAIGVPAQARAEAASILTCHFPKEASFIRQGSGEPRAQILDGAQEVIFSGLQSPQPMLKGNLGESPLRVIRRDQDAVWMVEMPSLGGVNIWTVFVDARVAILTKQTRPAVSPATFLGTLAMGTCR